MIKVGGPRPTKLAGPTQREVKPPKNVWLLASAAFGFRTGFDPRRSPHGLSSI